MQHTAHAHAPLNTEGFAHPARNVPLFEVQKGMSVADFGAGSGHYVWPIADAIGEHGHLFAIDIQRDLLKRIHNEAHRKGFKNVKIIWSDLETPKASKLADRSIDLVLISNLLFQIENKHAVLKEARRILRPSGSLIVIDWSDSFGMMGPHKDHVVTKEKGRTLIQENDLELVREFPAGAHHWGLIARPKA